jgi:hypothetical protein
LWLLGGFTLVMMGWYFADAVAIIRQTQKIEQVRVGMSRAEVENLIGAQTGPPPQYEGVRDSEGNIVYFEQGRLMRLVDYRVEHRSVWDGGWGLRRRIDFIAVQYDCGLTREDVRGGKGEWALQQGRLVFLGHNRNEPAVSVNWF